MKTSACIEYYVDTFRDVVAYATLQRYGTTQRIEVEGNTLAQCKRYIVQCYNVAPCNIIAHRFA